MAWVQADVDAVEEAIASGALRVAYQDKIVTYRNIGELERARSLIKQELAKASQTNVRSNQVRIGTVSGW